MDFDPPETVRPLLDKYERFIHDVVMPAEHEILERGFRASTQRGSFRWRRRQTCPFVKQRE